MAMQRVMEVVTPLGDDLLFHRLHAREEVSRLFEFELDLLSLKGNINLDDVVGKSFTVKLELPDDKVRYFNGFVSRFAQGGMHGRYHVYHATLRPWLWLLTRTSDCRIFQEQTVPDIIKAVFGDHEAAEFKNDLTGHYRKWTYCVQYRETDFNFVSRLMEQEGIYYYFTHEEGRHTLVLVDSYSKQSPFPGYEQVHFITSDKLKEPEQDHISEWRFSREIQPTAYAMDDYDYERPSIELAVKRKEIRGHAFADYEVYDYPGEYTQQPDGEEYARTRLDELQTQFEVAHGACNARGLCVGYLFKLVGQPRADQNREYVVLSATHQLEFGGYESTDTGGASYTCTFAVLSTKQQYRPQRLTPKPIVQGPQTAVVVGPGGDEIYTDKYGRVKVQFHWDRYGKKDENSSCWIRVAQMWAGKGWGSVSTPRIGHEVIVDFLEGDPDQPIIIGSVHNAENKPPHLGVVSGFKSNTHKGGGSNEMTLDDTAGKEKITIHGQYDMSTTVEHDQSNTVNNKLTETIKNDATIKITEGKYSHDVVANTADYHVQGALTEKYDTTQDTTVKGNITIKSTAGEILIEAANKITLHTGSSKIEMDSGGTIKIEGVDVTVKGSTIVVIKGGIVHSEADSEHQTKGAVVLSDGSATNTVKGGMVMLNP